MITYGFFSIFCCFSVISAVASDVYNEEYAVSLLPTNQHILTNFRFDMSTSTIADSPTNNHLFPRVISDIVKRYSLKSLSFSLTQGYYRVQLWGFSPAPSTPHGARVQAVFDVSEDLEPVEERWRNLIQTLSGYFCASLNQVVPSYTTIPTIGAETIDERFFARRDAMLSSENICTENLTPFKKLLPCKSKGLVSLLNGERLVHRAHHYALALNLFRNCHSKLNTCRYLDTSAYNLSITVRNIEHLRDHKSDFNFHLKDLCPLASFANLLFDTTGINFKSVLPIPTPSGEIKLNDRLFNHYDLVNDRERILSDGGLQMRLVRQVNKSQFPIRPTPVFLHSYIAGIGSHRGRIVTEIFNQDDRDLQAVYSHILPWFLRVYYHKLAVACNGTDHLANIVKKNIVAARDNGRPGLLELFIRLPGNSECVVSVEFERAFLIWKTYPPDANKGFDVPPASLRYIYGEKIENQCRKTNQSISWHSINQLKSIMSSEEYKCEESMIIYGEPLIVVMPVPDFSMPYNVLCLVCTILALAFGPIHTLTTRPFSYRKTEKKSRLQVYIDKLKAIFGFGQEKTTEDEVVAENG